MGNGNESRNVERAWPTKMKPEPASRSGRPIGSKNRSDEDRPVALRAYAKVWRDSQECYECGSDESLNICMPEGFPVFARWCRRHGVTRERVNEVLEECEVLCKRCLMRRNRYKRGNPHKHGNRAQGSTVQQFLETLSGFGGQSDG